MEDSNKIPSRSESHVLCGHNHSFKRRMEEPSIQDVLKLVEQLELYFRATGVGPAEQLEVALTCLTSCASDWSAIKRVNWKCFEDFKRDFLAHYWSDDCQRAERIQLNNQKFATEKYTSMFEYFAKQVGAYRCFVPPIPEGVIVSEIMRQLPLNVQSLWDAINDRTIDNTKEFLRRQSAYTGRPKGIPTERPALAAVSDRYKFASSATEDTPLTMPNTQVPPPTVCDRCQHSL